MTPRAGLRGAMVTEGAAVLLLLFVVFMFFFVAGFFALSPKSAAGAGGPWERSSESTTCSGPRDITARGRGKKTEKKNLNTTSKPRRARPTPHNIWA